MKIGGGHKHLQHASQDVQLNVAESGMPITTDMLAAQPVYHNPSPLVWLIGSANVAAVVVEGVEMMALVDTGSQISTLTEGFC